ncbi:hypothetical protein, partial [Acidisphaera rubrifaciens]|uniref:hypothetical protein n=1 Tax=Acidisphaera rubrifaciens TaxID=50715 RepID=UPI0006623C8D
MRRLLAGLLFLLAAAGQAAARDAATEVGVRIGAHAGFDRLVFDLPPGLSPQISVDGGHAEIRFGPATQVTVPARLPARIARMTVVDGRADIVLAHGASFRIGRLGTRLIVDIFPARAATDARRPS